MPCVAVRVVAEPLAGEHCCALESGHRLSERYECSLVACGNRRLRDTEYRCDLIEREPLVAVQNEHEPVLRGQPADRVDQQLTPPG